MLKQAADYDVSDTPCVLCLAVEATYGIDDILYPLPGVIVVCGFQELRQPPVHLDGYHAHAGQPVQCLLTHHKPAHVVLRACQYEHQLGCMQVAKATCILCVAVPVPVTQSGLHCAANRTV